MATSHKKQIMQNKVLHIIYNTITVGATLLLFSCMDNTIYHSNRIIKEREWNKHDTITFVIDTLPNAKNSNLKVEVRTRNNYPYKNLCLIVEQQWDKKQIIRNKVYLDISKPNNTSSVFLTPSSSIPINIKGTVNKGRINIYPYMKRESLPGINDVGILLTR